MIKTIVIKWGSVAPRVCPFSIQSDAMITLGDQPVVWSSWSGQLALAARPLAMSRPNGNERTDA